MYFEVIRGISVCMLDAWIKKYTVTVAFLHNWYKNQFLYVSIMLNHNDNYINCMHCFSVGVCK